MICKDDDYDVTFDFENILEGEDAKNFTKEASREICKFYLRGNCAKGKDCPFRHVRAEKAVVCKHWLRGLCKKGDACEFLHEYNPKKMPECWFFAKYEECSNPECIFLHIRKEDKVKPCPWFNRGFCKHGPNCRLKHILRMACPDYLAGFCPKGPNCKFAHPKFDIPKDIQDHLAQNSEFGVRRKALRKPNTLQQQRSIPTLHGDSTDHHSSARPMMNMHQFNSGNNNNINGNMGPGYQQYQQQQSGYQQHHHHQHQQQQQQFNNNNSNPGSYMQQKRPLDQVTCYKCKQKGHYANACPNPRLQEGGDAMQF